MLRRLLAQGVSQLALLVIKGYQVFVSPVIPPSCRFYPSCSEYAKQAFHYYGPFKAARLVFVRVLKCNPCHPGGCDFIPLPFSSKCDLP